MTYERIFDILADEHLYRHVGVCHHQLVHESER